MPKRESLRSSKIGFSCAIVIVLYCGGCAFAIDSFSRCGELWRTATSFGNKLLLFVAVAYSGSTLIVGAFGLYAGGVYLAVGRTLEVCNTLRRCWVFRGLD